MYGCKPVATPLVTNEKLMKKDGSKKANASIYRSLIGSLLYLKARRPNIMFAASLMVHAESEPARKRMRFSNKALIPKVVCYNKINYLKEGCTKWNGEMFMLWHRLLKKIRGLIFMLLNRLRKIIRLCFIAPYRWIFRRIRNLLLSIRRIFKYRVPLTYILLVNFISIPVGFYTWGMLVISREDKMKAEPAESAYNSLYKYPELDISNHVDSVDNIYIDQVEYINHFIYDSNNPIAICATLLALYIYVTR